MHFKSEKQEEYFKYLKANKALLIAEKQLEVKYTDSITHAPTLARREPKAPSTQKDDSSPIDGEGIPERDSIDVTVVCNTAWFCDSQMDVLTDSSYTKSIKAKGTSIPHIADHKQSSTAHVGDVTAIYTKVMPLAELGLDQEGSTTALVMESTVRKDYNDDVYKFYANGKINQHSIGLRYNDMAVAINSKHEDYKEELAVWEEYYPKVINKDKVDERGYFWLIKEVDIIENSCVLFGSNSLTPTLSMKTDSGEATIIKDSNQPQKGITMATTPLEDALTQVAALQAELNVMKASTSLEVAKAKTEEQARVLGIFEAAKTFSVSNETAFKFAKMSASVDVAVASFEGIKEAAQAATHVDTSGTSLTSTVVQTTTTGEKSAKDILLDTIAKADTTNPFEGML